LLTGKTDVLTDKFEEILSVEILIKNVCRKNYRPDPEKVIRKIIDRIPEEYLIGIKEVCLFESQKADMSKIKAILTDSERQFSLIKVDMSNKDFSGVPFFSILFLNIRFVEAIVDNYKMITNRSIKKGIGYDWMYFGIWQPINSLVKAYNLLIRNNKIFALINRGFDRLLIKIIGR